MAFKLTFTYDYDEKEKDSAATTLTFADRPSFDRFRRFYEKWRTTVTQTFREMTYRYDPRFVQSPEQLGQELSQAFSLDPSNPITITRVENHPSIQRHFDEIVGTLPLSHQRVMHAIDQRWGTLFKEADQEISRKTPPLPQATLEPLEKRRNMQSGEYPTAGIAFNQNCAAVKPSTFDSIDAEWDNIFEKQDQQARNAQATSVVDALTRLCA